MRRRTKWLIVITLSLLGVVACIFMAAPPQPSYQGRKLNEWLGDLSHPNYQTQQVARAAIQAMGPDAVPFLTNSLAQRNAVSIRVYRKNLIPRKLAAWTHRLAKWHTPMMESRSAAMALQALGPQGSNAIPALVAALQDPSWTVTQAAASALGAMGMNAMPALGERLMNANDSEMPWVLRAVAALETNAAPLAPRLVGMSLTNLPTADSAAYALGQIGPSAVPSITNVIVGANNFAQLRLLNVLRRIGPPAIVATNQLAELTRSTNPTVRLHARYVLMATFPPRELAEPFLVEGIHDADSTNVAACLGFLTLYAQNVLNHNREIAALTTHPTNSIAIAASNALTRFRAWPKQ